MYVQYIYYLQDEAPNNYISIPSQKRKIRSMKQVLYMSFCEINIHIPEILI